MIIYLPSGGIPTHLPEDEAFSGGSSNDEIGGPRDMMSRDLLGRSCAQQTGHVYQDSRIHPSQRGCSAGINPLNYIDGHSTSVPRR